MATAESNRYAQYSCARCRSRKIRCNRSKPKCSNCAEAATQCVYTARKARPRRTIQATRTHLILPAAAYPSPEGGSVSNSGDGAEDGETDDEDEGLLIPHELQGPNFSAIPGPYTIENGHLMVAHGKSRYVNAEKAQQISSLKSLLDSGSGDNQVDARISDTRAYLHKNSSSLLNPYKGDPSLQGSQRLPENMDILWTYYVQNIDMMVKILYKPSVEVYMLAGQTPSMVDATTRTLLFAIAMSSVTAMSPSDCKQLLRSKREDLLKSYRSCFEECLLSIGWMTTQNIVILQSVTLYLVFCPPKNVRSAWMLCGIALSIAQAMGLHRDDSSFSVPQIDIEVRRRVWWMLCSISNRIAEDCGLEPQIPLNADCSLPLNVNDSDLEQSLTATMGPMSTVTETTMSLAKMEFVKTKFQVKKLQFSGSSYPNQEIESLLNDKIRRFEEHYLPYFAGPSDLHRLCSLGTRLLMAKLWRSTIEQARPHGVGTDNQALMKLFECSVIILEILYQLPDNFRPFGWFFRCKYMQWPVTAFLLGELQKGINGPIADRARAALGVAIDNLEKGIGKGAHTQSNKMKVKLLQSMKASFSRIQHADTTVFNTFPDPVPDPVSSTLSEEQHDKHQDNLPSGFSNNELLGDPFLGFDTNQSLNWEEMDVWLRDLDETIEA